jgi:hypothetical protein
VLEKKPYWIERNVASVLETDKEFKDLVDQGLADVLHKFNPGGQLEVLLNQTGVNGEYSTTCVAWWIDDQRLMELGEKYPEVK